MKIKEFLDNVKYRFRIGWLVEPDYMMKIYENREIDEMNREIDEMNREVEEEKEFRW